ILLRINVALEQDPSFSSFNNVDLELFGAPQLLHQDMRIKRMIRDAAADSCKNSSHNAPATLQIDTDRPTASESAHQHVQDRQSDKAGIQVFYTPPARHRNAKQERVAARLESLPISPYAQHDGQSDDRA